MRVAHVMHGLMMGGLEQVVVRLCEAGRRQGVEPRVIAFGRDGAVRDELRQKGIPVDYLGMVRGMSPQAIHGIGQALRNNQIDVVHAHDLGPWLNAVSARALSPRTRAVATFHQIATPSGLNWGASLAASLMTDALIACGDEVKTCVKGWAPPTTPVELIGNGVPLGALPTPADRAEARRVLKLPEGARVFGYLGRLHPEKGTDLLIDAFTREFVREHDRDVHLVLIGTGDWEPALRERLARTGHPRVHFAGEIVDASRLLPALDVYVQPSRREGRSLSMMEAMAAALPTVAQALPAIRELHEEDRTALLVPPGAADFARPMRRLIEDGDLRSRLGMQARERVQRFSVDAMAEQYASLYRRVSRRATQGAA